MAIGTHESWLKFEMIGHTWNYVGQGQRRVKLESKLEKSWERSKT